MHDHRDAIPQQPDSKPVTDRRRTLLDSKTVITKLTTRIMKTPARVRLASLCIVFLPAFASTPCLAATGVLPWDQTLIAFQDIIAGPVAHAAIVLNFACSAILYTLGSRQFAGRLLAGGFASCAALIAVRLLAYIFPF